MNECLKSKLLLRHVLSTVWGVPIDFTQVSLFAERPQNGRQHWKPDERRCTDKSIKYMGTINIGTNYLRCKLCSCPRSHLSSGEISLCILLHRGDKCDIEPRRLKRKQNVHRWSCNIFRCPVVVRLTLRAIFKISTSNPTRSFGLQITSN